MKIKTYLRYYPIHDGRSVKAYGFAVVKDEDGKPSGLYHEVDYDVWVVVAGKPMPWTRWPDTDAATREEFFAFCREAIAEEIALNGAEMYNVPRSAFDIPATGEFLLTEENAPDPDGIEDYI